MTIKTKLLSLLLILCMLLPMAMPTALAADDSDALSFGNAESATAVTATVSPSQLLNLLGYGEISAAEADYLDRYCDRILQYYDRIPAERVRMLSDDTRLSVTAYPYSYKAENGVDVTWIPLEVVYADRVVMPLVKNGTGYEATVEGIGREISDRVGIVYTCTLSIPHSVVNAVSSFTYTDATVAATIPTTEEYAAARAAYLAYLSAMDDYADDVAAYEQYLSDKQDYLDEKAVYDDYLLKKAAYEEKHRAYVKYIETDLPAYAAAKAEYERVYRETEAAYADYVAYLNNLNRIRASMYAIESLFDPPSSGKTRNLYSALQNQELVSMFERYRDELVRIYGVSDDTLTHLYQSSNDLNDMLGEYAKARKTSEEAAFAYYKAHYHDISNRFNYLYDSMREVMSGMIFNHICSKMELEYKGEQLRYKKWRIKNIVAHIYLICQVLDDAETADGTFQFYADSGKKHTYYFSDLLDQNLILTDNNDACPDRLTWMPEQEPVTLPTPPKEPPVVERPTPPTVVSEPKEPSVVDQPIAPDPVDEVPEATEEELARYAFADRATAIVGALKAGTLSPRQGVTAAQTVELTTTLTRPIPFHNAKLVTLYQIDGSIFEVIEVAAGEPFALPVARPSYDDARYTYEFVGWDVSPDANPTEPLDTPTTTQEDLALYAIYHKTVKQYAVTVKLDANDAAPTTATYDYGAMPVLPARPEKPQTADTVYTFAGWSPEPSAVTGAVTYTAQWLTSERLYTVTWITTTDTVTRRLPYRSQPTPPTVPSLYYEGCVRYDFIGWGKTVAPVTADVTYEAQYRRTVLAESEEGTLTLTPSLGSYHLSSTSSHVTIGGMLEKARAERKRVTLALPSMHVAMDVNAVNALQTDGVTYAAMLTDTSGGVGIGFYDADGNRVNVSNGTVRLTIPYTPVEGAILSVLADDGAGHVFLVPSAVEEGSLVVEAAAHRTYRADVRYALTLKGEGGTLLASTSLYFVGEKPSITTYPAPNYLLDSVILTNDLTGESITLSSLHGFTMPAYPATLRVTFVPKTYTVTFISRGEAVSEESYVLGDSVKIPEIETDFEEDGYRYTFIGWSAPVGAVTGDMTYTAKFFAVPLESVPDNPTGEEWAIGTALWQIVLPIGLIAVTFVTGIVLLVKLCRKKKKKKKKA